MRRLSAALSVAFATACAHAAPPAEPASTPVTIVTPIAAATPPIAAATASASATATPTPCPLSIDGAYYYLGSPIPLRRGEKPRPSSLEPVPVTVIVERAGNDKLIGKSFTVRACIDVPPGPVTLLVSTHPPYECASPLTGVVVPAHVVLQCRGPLPP